MVKALQYSDLDPKMCRLETFDGVGNMTRKTKGAATQFCLQIENEKAVYFHCASHELNLCLSKFKSKLKPMCETRWIERHTTFEELENLFEPFIHSFESIQRNGEAALQGVLRKRASENRQEIYRRTPIPKSGFNKVVLQLY